MKNGVICLFTAAQYYELTTVNPAAIDIAVPLVGKKPLLPEYPPINLYTVKKSIFDIGIAEIKIDTGSLKMYDKERTICDFFRMRLQIGEDVALEVLKNYMAQNGKNLQKLFEYASRLRIKSIIKPYVEALL
jgi:predicted transcriptional regulator of viral defense system